MNKIFSVLKQVDLFGVPIQILTNERQKNHTSILGGITSLLVALTSLGYFIYVLLLWLNHEIAPNVNSKQVTNEYSEFQWKQPLIEFTLQDFLSVLDPFQEQNNIVTPLLFTVSGDKISESPTPLFGQRQRNSSFIKFSIQNGSLVQNSLNIIDSEHKALQQYLLVFVPCQEKFMTSTSNCAKDDVISDYFSQSHGFMFMDIKLGQLNLASQQIENYSKSYYTAFLPKEYQFTQVLLKQQETILDDGIIFRNDKSYQFLNNFEIINQQVDQQFMLNLVNYLSNNTYQINTFSSYLFSIDAISISQEVMIPKLGQILAQIGSIVQVIFLLQYGVKFYNQNMLEQELLYDIISMYYPELKNYKSSYNVLKKNKICSEENIKFIKKYQNLYKKAKEKCRLNNIIYELSRVQFVLQNIFGSSILSSSHQFGSKIISTEPEEILEFQEMFRLSVKPQDSIDSNKSFIQHEPLQLLIKSNPVEEHQQQT